ncbi:hypothetical protein EKG38_20180 [Shewanella canadensis]|uniref:PspA/IM30 family protein n=1 Tax=Shewanella canadensis TaxID=271096 RepID=A0A431WP67_9GAMM|nr:hypothetical protein [Shewanella canadensis]RTR37253.1 hypothetical protein EKG38_20180 [Shewanella canadensis]
MQLIIRFIAALRRAIAMNTEKKSTDKNGHRLEPKTFGYDGHACQIKHELTYINAHRAKLVHQSTSLEEQIREKEVLAIRAIKLGDEALAYSIAELIADKENEQSALEKRLEQVKNYEHRLIKQLKCSVQQIQDYRHELEQVQVIQRVQRLYRIQPNMNTIGKNKLAVLTSRLMQIQRKQTCADTETMPSSMPR